MNKHSRTISHNAEHRGFTLIELLVAIAVLLVVILATSRIFGTASQVTGLGQASAMVMQEAAALERRLREDIANLSHDGFFVIRQVAVRNDVNVGNGGPLLNPFLPEDAIIRADQLVFFTDAVASLQTAGLGGGYNIRGQGTSSRVYYGHVGQLPNGGPYTGSGSSGTAHDPGPPAAQANPELFMLRPWRWEPMPMLRTFFSTVSDTNINGTNIYQRQGPFEPIDAAQPDALRWLLARQAVALVDDDKTASPDSNSKTVYLNENRVARSIFIDHVGRGHTREIRNGRMDGASSRLDDIRRYVTRDPANGNPRPWSAAAIDQRTMIARAAYYPRGERTAPSAHRVDQALTNHIIGSGVSSFIVEWTYEEGTGEMRDADGNIVVDAATGVELWGLAFNSDPSFEYQPEQPWFGLNNWDGSMSADSARGVGFYGRDDAFQQPSGAPYWEVANFWRPPTIFIGNNNVDNNIERYYPPNTAPYFLANTWVYEATFGYNRDRPLNRFGETDPDLGYTPWPSAIRVTVVMHDPGGRLEHGREFQFVIDLPRRGK